MDARELFFFAMEKYSNRVEITELRLATLKHQLRPQGVATAEVWGNIGDTTRQSGNKPATMTLVVEDDVVKNLRGAPDDRHTYLLVKIPNDVAKRRESRIILPGEDR